MRLREKKSTTKVIAKAKTLVGQAVEILHYVNPANPFRERFSWKCGGCGAEHEVTLTDTRDGVTRAANSHAGLCRITPA